MGSRPRWPIRISLFGLTIRNSGRKGRKSARSRNQSREKHNGVNRTEYLLRAEFALTFRAPLLAFHNPNIEARYIYMRVRLSSAGSTALAAFALLAGAAAAWGQATTSLRGSVKDAQGAAIDAATVSLLRTDTGFRRAVLTDTTGEYQLVQVPPGSYMLTVQKPGFAILSQK